MTVVTFCGCWYFYHWLYLVKVVLLLMGSLSEVIRSPMDVGASEMKVILHSSPTSVVDPVMGPDLDPVGTGTF